MLRCPESFHVWVLDFNTAQTIWIVAERRTCASSSYAAQFGLATPGAIHRKIALMQSQGARRPC